MWKSRNWWWVECGVRALKLINSRQNSTHWCVWNAYLMYISCDTSWNVGDYWDGANPSCETLKFSWTTERNILQLPGLLTYYYYISLWFHFSAVASWTRRRTISLSLCVVSPAHGDVETFYARRGSSQHQHDTLLGQPADENSSMNSWHSSSHHDINLTTNYWADQSILQKRLYSLINRISPPFI